MLRLALLIAGTREGAVARAVVGVVVVARIVSAAAAVLIDQRQDRVVDRRHFQGDRHRVFALRQDRRRRLLVVEREAGVVRRARVVGDLLVVVDGDGQKEKRRMLRDAAKNAVLFTAGYDIAVVGLPQPADIFGGGRNSCECNLLLYYFQWA